VSIIGGEPLLLPYLHELVLKLRHEISINLDSNLILFNETIYENLKGRINQWNTTIDSYLKKVHNFLRGGFEQTIKAIKFLVEQGERVGVNVVVNKMNYKHLDKTVKFLQDLKVCKITLTKIKPFGRGNKSILLLSGNSLEKAARKVSKVAHEYSNVIPIGWFHKSIKEKALQSCYCGILKLTIDWKGYIHACELMIGKKSEVSIEKVSNLTQALEKMNWYCRSMVLPSSCKTCKRKSFCNKGCRYITILSAGTSLAKPIECKVKENSIYEVIGYEYFSPLFKEGRKRWKTEKAKILLSFLRNIKEPIVECGCGGGVWVFFLEKNLRKPITGIEINPTMIDLFEIYKNLNNMQSEVLKKDVRKYNFKGECVLLLDNFIHHLTKREIKRIVKRSSCGVIEFDANKPKGGTFIHNIYGKKIKETIKIMEDSKETLMEKTFDNGLAKATITLHYHPYKNIIKFLDSYYTKRLGKNFFIFFRN
jgi:radical SAM protein with 4Fe4S-binding SPASM domain